MTKYNQVAQVLDDASNEIAAILKDNEDELHRLKLLQTLKRQKDYILLITNSGDPANDNTAIPGPAKTIGGVPIQKIRSFTEADLVPSDDKVFQLKQQVESAHKDFSTLPAEQLLVAYDELVIRGVAKKAGLKVTKDNPEKITLEFVQEIKNKIGGGNELWEETDKDNIDNLAIASERVEKALLAHNDANQNLETATKANKSAKDIKPLKLAVDAAEKELKEAMAALEQLQTK